MTEILEIAKDFADDLARMIGHKDLRSLMVYYNATASEIANRLD